jgi:hypothetical protein
MFFSRLPLLPLVLDDVPWGLRQMLAQEGIPTVSRDRRGGRGCFLLHDSRNGSCRRPMPGQIPIDIDWLRTGFNADPFDQWGDYRTSRFQWRLNGLHPSEEICRIDKRGLRLRLMARLRRIIERRGGVWLGIAPYPFPYRCAFNLRIDYDEYDSGDFDRLQKVLEGRQDAVSHFVCGASYETHDDALARLQGLDVGSHGYRHHTYRTFEENLRNIQRGIQVLEQARLRPVGFTAPHGRFNRSLLAAMEQLEIGYSSEFAIGYDEMPFLPAGSNVLQIPVHPVCLGILLEAARMTKRQGDDLAVAAAIEHFRSVIEAKYSGGEPIFLYGHPTGRLGRYPEVVESIFKECDRRSDIWRVTMSQWAAWWRARSRVRLTVSREANSLVVELDQNPSRFRIGLEYHRGREVARLALDGARLRILPAAIPYETRSERPAFQPVRVDRPHGLRVHVRRWIDWERETPVEEIVPTNWRNLAKRTLRSLWR